MKKQIRNSTAEFLLFTAQAGEESIEVRVEDGRSGWHKSWSLSCLMSQCQPLMISCDGRLGQTTRSLFRIIFLWCPTFTGATQGTWFNITLSSRPTKWISLGSQYLSLFV